MTPCRRSPEGVRSPRAGSAGQDADGHDDGQAGDQQEQTVPAHRVRDPITRDKLPRAAQTNCPKLFQLVRMPITIKTARPIGRRSRLLCFMMVDISGLP